MNSRFGKNFYQLAKDNFMRFIVFASALAATVILAGCAAQVIASTPRSVTIQAGSVMVGDATKAAQTECQKHGLHARLSGKNTPNQFVFDCVQ
jgi:hypothetical protein